MAKTLVYQLHPSGWPGGIKEMKQHVTMMAELGVDFVWLSPLYPSPQYDFGYDIADYKEIDPRYGTINDFDELVKEIHRYGMGVLMDLVLNHTSTEHEWFKARPQYYCWSDSDRKGWKNLFNGGSAWQYDTSQKQYYLHLFHEKQADLNWFINGEINRDLVHEFRDIVKFWTINHKIDGFRLDVLQSINKDFSKENLEFSDLLNGTRAVEVIDSVFGRNSDLFLIMECFDPTFGDLIEYYAKNTAVDYVLNAMLKDEIRMGDKVFNQAFDKSVSNIFYMLDLESHDSPRFTSSSGWAAEDIFIKMFKSSAQAICLYQGQELGLENPNKNQLSDEKMLNLDTQTAMRAKNGESLEKLRPIPRANARVPLPLDEYQKQLMDNESNLNKIMPLIDYWKQC